MKSYEQLKLEFYHYLILVAAIIFLPKYVGNFISKYISWLVGTWILSFISILIVLIIFDKLLHKFLLKES